MAQINRAFVYPGDRSDPELQLGLWVRISTNGLPPRPPETISVKGGSAQAQSELFWAARDAVLAAHAAGAFPALTAGGDSGWKSLVFRFNADGAISGSDTPGADTALTMTNAIANRLFVEAMKTFKSIETVPEEDRGALYLDVKAKIDRLYWEHPSSKLAERIQRGEPLGPLNLSELDDLAAEARVGASAPDAGTGTSKVTKYRSF